jgi:hypothetical protein
VVSLTPAVRSADQLGVAPFSHKIVGSVIFVLWWSLACGDSVDEAARRPEAAVSHSAVMNSPVESSSASKSNRAPRIAGVSFEPDVPALGETLKAVVDASDEDADLYWLSYSWKIAGEPVATNENQIGLQDVRRGDIISLEVRVTDGKQAGDPFLVELSVGNAPPRITGVGILPGGEISRGMPITLRPESSDVDGDPIEHRYEWIVDGRPHPALGPELKTDRIRRGSVVVGRVFASDGDIEGEPFLTPEITIANAPPTILSTPGGSSDEGVFEYRVEVSDADGDRNIRFSLEEAPKGMEIDALEGVVSWHPGNDQDGIHQPIVVADDSNGGQTRQEIEVRVGEGNAEPSPARGEW